MNWAHAGTAILAAFLASLVEFVEALTIVLAVGTTRGWRAALTGAGTGAAFLVLLTLAFGPALQRIPITSLQLVVGILLLFFGMRWLRKAALRAAGVIGLHDESAIFAKESAALSSGAIGSGAMDRVAFLSGIARDEEVGMSALTRVAAELWGLFVEDVSFTAAIVACLAFAWLLLPALTIPSPWRGALLFVLLAGALIENVSRSARR